MGGTYLEVIGCLGAALVGLLGGVMDFNTPDGGVAPYNWHSLVFLLLYSSILCDNDSHRR